MCAMMLAVSPKALVAAIAIALALGGYLAWSGALAPVNQIAPIDRPASTVERSADGTVVTIDLQGPEVVFSPVGTFTTAPVQLSGPWTIGAASGAYGGQCAWAPASLPGPGETRGPDVAFAYIRPALPISGTYDVSIWKCAAPLSNLNPSQEIELIPTTGFGAYHAAHTDLQQGQGVWEPLGAVYLEPNATVVVDNWHGAVAIDAIRFAYHPNAPTATPSGEPRPAPSPAAMPKPNP
jgi:hypothetical protein